MPYSRRRSRQQQSSPPPQEAPHSPNFLYSGDSGAQRRLSPRTSFSQYHHNPGLHSLPESYMGTPKSSFASQTGGSLEDSSLHSSTAPSTQDSKVKGISRIVHATVPFYVQVLLLMMIPCTFLVAFASTSLSEASGSKRYVGEHSSLIKTVFKCSSALMVERGLMSLQVGVPLNHSDYNRTMELLVPAALNVNAQCGQVIEETTQSGDEGIRIGYRRLMVQAMADWEGFRKQAALQYLTPEIDSKRWEAVETVNSALSFLSRHPKARLSSKYLTLLLLARTMANSLGTLRAAGGIYLAKNGSAPSSLVSHFNDLVGRYEAAKANFKAFQSQTGRVWIDAFQYEPDIVRAWEMAAEVRQGNPLYLTVDPLEYFFLFTDALVSMHQLLLVPGGLLEKATSGEEEEEQLVSSALQLVFALLCSGAAATFLVIRQKKNVAEMAKALDQAKVMNAGVRRYVPKRFLALMGSTSILQLHVGDFTEVAVTMLFSDIRSFTDISCTLSNSELFSWLSNYLVRMTTVTEKHHGFVDKFVGDAIFSVFTQPKNGVTCAIEMQILADGLSLEVVGKQNKKDIVRIGVGVHHGIVAAGILGDDSRHTATLISSDVNLASRLEGLTKHFGARILVSAAVANHLPPEDFCYRRLGRIQAKGQTDTLEIYEVFQADPLPLKEFKQKNKQKFERAIRFTDSGDVESATELLLEIQQEEQELGQDALLLSPHSPHNSVTPTNSYLQSAASIGMSTPTARAFPAAAGEEPGACPLISLPGESPANSDAGAELSSPPKPLVAIGAAPRPGTDQRKKTLSPPPKDRHRFDDDQHEPNSDPDAHTPGTVPPASSEKKASNGAMHRSTSSEAEENRRVSFISSPTKPQEIELRDIPSIKTISTSDGSPLLPSSPADSSTRPAPVASKREERVHRRGLVASPVGRSPRSGRGPFPGLGVDPSVSTLLARMSSSGYIVFNDK